MKKMVLAALAVVAAPAMAQSSVTLYGLIDEGANFTNNADGHRAYQMSSGDTFGSRWGLKGGEDLGNGDRAIFVLENGFNVNTGKLQQDSSEFGRQAYVGLASKRYGTITLGRQYDTSVDSLGFSTVTATGSWSGDINAHPFDNDNLDWDFRVNNAVKYVSPTVGGLTGEAMYGFSKQAGGFASNRVWGATLNYQNRGLTAIASYLKLDNPGSAAGGAVNHDDLFDAASQQNIDVGVSYRLPKVLVGAAYSHVDVDGPTGNGWMSTVDLPNGGAWNAWKFDNLEINTQYYFTPSFWLGGAYTFTMAHLHSSMGDYAPKWHQIGLMLDYDLSKRTSLYVQGAYQHVVSAHTGTSFDYAQIVDASAGASSSQNQMVYRVGLIHQF